MPKNSYRTLKTNRQMNRDAFHYFLYQDEDLIRPGEGRPETIGGLVLCYELQLSPSERELLVKILESINFSIQSAREFDLSHETFELDDFNNATILSFGPGVPGIEKGSKYELIQAGTNRCILADTLSAIAEDINLKKDLWKALKSLI